MELEFETRTTDYLRQSIEGVCRQEQTLEVIVPDASPDAARVVYCGAQAVVRSRECRSGAIELTGGIQAGAVYLTEADGAPRALTAWLPFTLRLEHPAAKDDTQILMDCRVLAADARLVNSRKILFRAEVGAQIMGFAADRIELPLLKQTPPELQLRCRNYPLPLPAETAERTYLVGDELDLPAGSSVPQTIVSAAARGLQIECGCFGGGGSLEAGQSTAYTAEILRDTALLLVSLYLGWRWRSRYAADDAVRASAKVPEGRIGPKKSAQARKRLAELAERRRRAGEKRQRIATGVAGSTIVFGSSNTSKMRSVAVRASSRNEKRNPIDSIGQRSTVAIAKKAMSSALCSCPTAVR